MDISQLRLHNQRLVGGHFSTPLELVQWFGAVQAQEYYWSLWALGIRLPAGVTEQSVAQAIDDRTIVRTWPMRGTIHYIPAQDVSWMQALLARRVNVKSAYRLKSLNLTPDVLALCGKVFKRALSGGKQLTRQDLYAALLQQGVDPSQSRGLHALSYWAQESLICFGPRQGKQPTYVLLHEWAPNQRALTGDQALAELARRYFRSHGPATVRDFAWWSGLTLGESRKAASLVQQEFARHDQSGSEYWLPLDFAPKNHGPTTLLLPRFDEYTVAYKDRSAAVSNDLLLQTGYGVNNNNIVVDGRIVGMWNRSLKKDAVTLTCMPLQPLSLAVQAQIAAQAKRYGGFLGLSTAVEYK
ncbi:MAG TPA: winged helix DNA-binding domain-containing protein [Candidatus Saccharimonadales bacterium]|nr:winged helix DNA-binding domain-containing protein [Candidatus Saccharimonadales bacterium]